MRSFFFFFNFIGVTGNGNLSSNNFKEINSNVSQHDKKFIIKIFPAAKFLSTIIKLRKMSNILNSLEAEVRLSQ
jgi:hypothetical protein